MGRQKPFTEAQKGLLAELLAAEEGKYLSLKGVKPQTIGALVGAGLVAVKHDYVEQRYRPTRRGFYRQRQSRMRMELVDIRLTPAGRDAAKILTA